MNVQLLARLMITILVLCICTISAKWIAKAVFSPTRTQQALPVLNVPQDRLNFGETNEQPTFRWIVPITNTESTDVTIEQFHQSCSCTRIVPETLRIPAKQTREVEVTLDLRLRGKLNSITLTQTIEAQIAPVGSLGGGADWESMCGPFMEQFVHSL